MNTKTDYYTNRKSGKELLDYLQSQYALSEIYDKDVITSISENVMQNEFLSEKLQNAVKPIPKAFYLKNEGNRRKYYFSENKDSNDL